MPLLRMDLSSVYVHAGIHGPLLDETDLGETRSEIEPAGKPCQTCGRPFTWRKKWERVWDEVKFCSERCRREARNAKLPRT